MIRSVNDQFGFADRYTTNELIMDWDTYPDQYQDALGKYIALNLFSERDRYMKYRVRIVKSLKEAYSELIPDTYESSEMEVFRILRYDLAEPYKVILVSLAGQVIVTTKERIEDLVYIDDDMCNRAREYINGLGEEYLEPVNVVDNYTDFFTKFFEEKIECFPVQNQDMLLRPVYIEYLNDVLNQDIDFNEGPDKNNHDFTEEIKQAMISRNPKLEMYSDREIDSYPYMHDIHGESFVDDPRRTKSTQGIIIRADQNATEPEIVVMLQVGDEDNSYRIITLDEARFFYDTEKYIRTKQLDESTIYDIIYDYIVNGNVYEPEE